MRKDSYNRGKEKLTPIDFDHLRKSVEFRLIVEIFRNLFLIPDQTYFTSYESNAEILERDMEIWKELDKIEEAIKK
jgi:hypothetical protein